MKDPTEAPHAATDDFARFANEAARQWEKALAGWWDEVLDSPAVLGAVREGLGSFARARRTYEDGVDDQLRKLHLPNQGDFVRLARIATLLERRLLEVEDRILAMEDTLAGRLGRLEKEALQARIEAAEARIEMRARLSAIEDRLGGAEVPPGPSSRRPPRSKGG